MTPRRYEEPSPIPLQMFHCREVRLLAYLSFIPIQSNRTLFGRANNKQLVGEFTRHISLVPAPDGTILHCCCCCCIQPLNPVSASCTVNGE